jgi:fused signal recognition particle receptor
MFGFLKTSFSKIKKALSKTRSALGDKIATLFTGKVNDEALTDLEQILFEADLGTDLSIHLVDEIRRFSRKNPDATQADYLGEMKKLSLAIFDLPPKATPKTGTPHVILVVGVNGSGKTTSIAKLAEHYKRAGKKVLLAAADTFRAAAVEQLTHWAKKSGAEIVKGKMGADPSAVVYDAMEAAKARNCDIAIVDTAGRLQSKTDLMQELEKIVRVTKKTLPDAPHETYLVVDATTGQNAIDQAITFNKHTPLTGLVLTKLDGSAKGGIALAIYHKLQIPIVYVGLGEKIDDLEPFDATSYINALFAE